MSGIYIKGMEMPKSCFDCKMMVAKAVNEIEIMKYCCFLRKTALGVNRRKDCPLVEVPEQKHGKWIEKEIRGDIRTVCSNCEEETGTMYEFNFCPNCGADMREESVDIPMEYFESGGK